MRNADITRWGDIWASFDGVILSSVTNWFIDSRTHGDWQLTDHRTEPVGMLYVWLGTTLSAVDVWMYNSAQMSGHDPGRRALWFADVSGGNSMKHNHFWGSKTTVCFKRMKQLQGNVSVMHMKPSVTFSFDKTHRNLVWFTCSTTDSHDNSQRYISQWNL